MSLEFNVVLMLLIGYLFGSIPVAYIYCKSFGINIFNEGSGNPGSTNVKRVLGKKHGNIVFAFDILKTLTPIFVAHLIVISMWGNSGITSFTSIINHNLSLNLKILNEQTLRDPFVIFTTGFGAILGHNYPFTTKFKGGKGIACTVAVVAYFNVIFAIVLYLIHKLIGKFTGYVSVASILTLVVLFISSFILSSFKIHPFNFDYTNVVLVEIFIIMVLGIARHKDNIKRYRTGKENKI